MPTERISMRRVRELIRLSEAGLSVRQLAGALRLSVGAVSKYGRALRAAGLTWAVAQTLDDGELERRLFGAPAAENGFAAPDCAWIHQELKRHRSVTLKLLWRSTASNTGHTLMSANDQKRLAPGKSLPYISTQYGRR